MGSLAACPLLLFLCSQSPGTTCLARIAERTSPSNVSSRPPGSNEVEPDSRSWFKIGTDHIRIPIANTRGPDRLKLRAQAVKNHHQKIRLLQLAIGAQPCNVSRGGAANGSSPCRCR